MLNASNAELVRVADATRIPINVTWHYTRDEPYRVQLVFHGAGPYGTHQHWYFARDLLLEGIDSERWVGDGDVELARTSLDELAIWLETPDARVLVLADGRDAADFATSTELECPPGHERMSDGALFGGPLLTTQEITHG